MSLPTKKLNEKSENKKISLVSVVGFFNKLIQNNRNSFYYAIINKDFNLKIRLLNFKEEFEELLFSPKDNNFSVFRSLNEDPNTINFDQIRNRSSVVNFNNYTGQKLVSFSDNFHPNFFIFKAFLYFELNKDGDLNFTIIFKVK